MAELNVVAQEQIWKERVQNEKLRTKQWSSDWGMLLDYDYKCRYNPKPKKDLETNPECSTIFSKNVPNTTSGNYGKHGKSNILKMEF